jgi:DNA polymerase III epsilon subunit-like protein
MDLCYKAPWIKFKELDNICSKLDLPMRSPDRPHDALVDAKLAANVYMDLMKRPPPKICELGFGP